MNTETDERERLQHFRFWGGIMIGICFLTGLVAYGGGRYSFGVFIKPMSEALGWSRTKISLGATINLVSYALASPFVGKILDSYGIRVSMVVGAVILGVSFSAIYFCDSLWMFYLLYGVASAVGVNMVGRLAQATIVANWFVLKRGLMFGITALSIGLGTTVMAPITNAVLQGMGWKTAFLFLGGMIFALILLPSVFLIKGRGYPEDRQFGPDGAPMKRDHKRKEGPETGETDTADDWTVREAFGTAALWGILISMGLSYMADYMVLFHGIPCFQDRGLSPATAAAILAAGTLVSCAGRVGFGWLADRIDIRNCIALMLLLQITASPFIITGGASKAMLYTFIAIWGMGYGALGPLMPAISSQYFGRANFGAILGVVTMATVIGGAVGSTLGGWIYDMKGNYDLAWYACIVMWVVAGVTVYTMAGKPRRKLDAGYPIS